MSQEQIILDLVIVYFSSSWAGAILFSVVWFLTHKDRIDLREQPGVDRRTARLRNAAAIRNEVVAGVMACCFWLYTVVGTLSLVRMLNLPWLQLPWEPGLVTTALLVLGNFLEFLIAVSLLLARRAMNRG
jgi:hypothetical protein